ncbi:MAG: formylglycine-generating enzyme family protein [Acidimicrobiia bacterium]
MTATYGRVAALCAPDADVTSADIDWFTGPHGMLLACREAVASRAVDELLALDMTALFDALDDTSVAMTGPAPSDRAQALLAAAALARWSADDRAGAIELTTTIARGYHMPGRPRPALPAVDVVDAPDPVGFLAALIARARDDGGLAAAFELVGHLLGPDERDRAPHTAVPVLVSRHADGDVALLELIEATPGAPPGFALDVVAAPFLRVDARFQTALDAAWTATAHPSSVRWSLRSLRTGRPLSTVSGPSIGLGACVALARLGRPKAIALAPDWTFTGAIDATGATTTLLGPDRELAEYHAKVRAADRRTIVLPAVDHSHVGAYVEASGADVQLVGVVSADDALRHAARHVAGAASYERALRKARAPRRTGRRILGLAGVVLVTAVAVAVVLLLSSDAGRDRSIPTARGQEMIVAGSGQTPAFRMGVTEVTNGRYRLCMRAGVCGPPQTSLQAPGSPIENPANDDFPVTGVSAIDARSFCEWIGRELPSLDQWQLAASARSFGEWPLSALSPGTYDFPRGNEPGGSPAAVRAAVDPATAPSKDPKAVQPSFLVRNVAEWSREVCEAGQAGACRDWDGSAPEQSSMRVLGLSFNVGRVPPNDTRWWTDGSRKPARLGAPDVGFRCVGTT